MISNVLWAIFVSLLSLSRNNTAMSLFNLMGGQKLLSKNVIRGIVLGVVRGKVGYYY